MSKIRKTLSSESLTSSAERMVLRSACTGYACNANLDLTDSPKRSGSPRSQVHQHHHHHHHHHKINNTPPSQALSTEQLNITKRSTVVASYSSTIRTSRVVSNGEHQKLQDEAQVSPINRGSTVSRRTRNTANLATNIAGRSFSDYSSGFDSDFEDKPKTDYTYARSTSYKRNATPSRDSINPIMSRHKLRSASDVSSEEESFKIHEPHSLTKVELKYAAKKRDGLSTPYYFINNLNLNNRNTSASVSTRNNSDSQEVLHLKNQVHSYSFFQKTVTTITSVITTIISAPIHATSSFWFWLWSLVYQFICNILVLDTYVLSRSRNSWRKKLLFLLLLPLLVPLLFWLFGSGFHKNESSPIHNPSAQINGDLERVSDWNFIKAGNWMNWIMPFWVDRSKTTVSERSQKFESDLDSDHLKVLLKEMLEKEIAFLSLKNEQVLKEQVLELTKERDSLKLLQEEQKRAFALQTNELNKELESIRLESSRNEETVNVVHNSECSEIRLQVGRVETELNRLQDELMLLRNCCRNQTYLFDSMDKRYAGLLYDILNGSGPRVGPFAHLTGLFHQRFVSEFKQQTEDESKRMEKDLERLRLELREEMKREGTTYSSLNINQSHTCASEDAVQKIVRNALFIYDADKIGKFDYALETAGGSVISTRCTETYHSGTAQFSLFGVPIWYTSNSPRTVIQPDVKPGQCWALKGTTGYLVIQLSAHIRPTAFTLEHIPKSLSPNGRIDSAPREFSVLGLNDEKDFEGVHLGRYTYLDNDESLQYFIVQDPDPGYFPIMELRIHSNHGNMDYTCLYRFRVHGTPQ